MTSDDLLQFEPYINLSQKLPDDLSPTQVIVRESELEYIFEFSAYFGSGKRVFSAIWSMDLGKFYFSVKNETYLPGRTQQEELLTDDEFMSEIMDVFSEKSYTIQH